MSDKIRAAEIKAGAVVVAAAVILIGGSLWIAGSRFLGSQRVSYRVLMDDSGGLQAGDRVRVSGVSVGRIQQVELRSGDVMPVVLHVSIKRETSLGTDSSANIATTGLLGASYLQIDAGSASAPRLPEDGEIVGLSSAGLQEALAHIDEISRRVVDVLNQTAGVLDTLSGQLGPILSNLEVLLSETNAHDVRAILANLRTVSEDAGPTITSSLKRLERASEHFEDGVGEMPELMDRISNLVESVHQALGRDGDRLADVLDSADRSLKSADEAMSVVSGNRVEIEAMLRDLRDTAANLKAFSQQIKEKPFSVVRVKPEPERRPGDGVRE